MLQNVPGGAGGVDEASLSDALGLNPSPYLQLPLPYPVAISPYAKHASDTQIEYVRPIRRVCSLTDITNQNKWPFGVWWSG